VQKPEADASDRDAPCGATIGRPDGDEGGLLLLGEAMEAVRRRVSGYDPPQDAVLLLEPGQRLLGAAADRGLELASAMPEAPLP
jgi:hypothetical protein